MPLPLGHAVVGLATFKTVDRVEIRPVWILLAMITVLANLPDIDVVMGLMARGNGNLFHRGPTHSLLFALASGWLASRAWRINRHIPRLSFPTCSSIVFSHILADMAFTSAPVSLLWPFEVHWSGGTSDWGQVVHAIVFESVEDIGIVAGAALYMAVLGLIRRWVPDLRAPVTTRRGIR